VGRAARLLSAAHVIRVLDLTPHPEGGHFRETFRDRRQVEGGRGQAAQSLGDWTLAGCTVAPGFEFAAFEMAVKDWRPDL
jgi:predicted cupin superfamily sugar epimerase